MVEAGVRFVTVNGWAGQADHETKGPPASSWDMHGGNMGMGDAFGNGSYGMGFCLPRLDQALSALLTDLKERGMLENTLVVVTGEFGRTPKVLTQQPPGRQHWPRCFSTILAGAGIAGGQLYGKSDKHATQPIMNPVKVEELAATIYHAMDIPINGPETNSGISRPLTTGKPVMELFG
jgi:arylsulfatase A-like enzyme